MRFVSVRQIAQALDIHLSVVDNTLIQTVQESVNQHFSTNHSLHISNYDFSFQEVQFVLDTLSTPKNYVFHDWIHQDTKLYNYLISNGELIESGAVKSFENHQLEASYKKYIALFLHSILKRNIDKSIQDNDIETLSEQIEFCKYLPNHQLIEIQNNISPYVRSLINQIEDSEVFEMIFTQNFIKILNELDRHFYSDSILLLDKSREIIENTEVTPSTLAKIRSLLLRLDLNPTHQKQVQEFSKTSVFRKPISTPKGQIKKRIKSPLFILLLFAVFLGIGYAIFQNYPKSDDKITISGADSLTEQELIKLDSLMGFKVDSTVNKIHDAPYVSPNTSYILSRNWDTIKNEQAKAIYQSMIDDFEIQQSRGFGGCNSTAKKLYNTTLYENVLRGEEHLTNHKIRNNSNDDLYVLFFDPSTNGSVYGVLIAPNRSAEIQIEKGNVFVFYSGQQMNEFHPMKVENNGYGNVDDAKRISKDFTFHFCYQNYYNLQMLNQIFIVENLGQETVFKVSMDGYFEVESDALVSE